MTFKVPSVVLLTNIDVAPLKARCIFQSHIWVGIILSGSCSRYTCSHLHSEAPLHLQSYKWPLRWSYIGGGTSFSITSNDGERSSINQTDHQMPCSSWDLQEHTEATETAEAPDRGYQPGSFCLPLEQKGSECAVVSSRCPPAAGR